MPHYSLSSTDTAICHHRQARHPFSNHREIILQRQCYLSTAFEMQPQLGAKAERNGVASIAVGKEWGGGGGVAGGSGGDLGVFEVMGSG
ncbi:hypothetical protein F383_01485 [Gossypium arboreum]|uniref:Uncharacterized protein n=1 Tax=Gossypium arboreum TaxID=29729 RepID=A0A0B0PFH6_GOSAR|nr:hypothetical protein F383_01485 [Gossypium arboreum]